VLKSARLAGEQVPNERTNA